ncbi:CPBP family intramembrane glutamic endopeptidase [Enterococcus sp. LJL99]
MEKKRMSIFIGISYGIPLVSAILMYIGYTKKLNLAAFAAMFMYLPAMAVMVGILLTNKNKLIPKRFFISFILVAIIAIICAWSSVLFPADHWPVIMEIISMIGSILLSIFLFTEKKEKRIAYGLKGTHWKISFGLIALFLILYVLRNFLTFSLGGQFTWIIKKFSKSESWLQLMITFALYLVNWIMYFGEEYGWRYYLQPILQKRFGTFKGILLLGFVWGIWHAPLNFFFYATPDIGIFSLLGQIVNCTGLGIFFAYCYMKTENIWLVTIFHYINNNLVALFSDPTASANTNFSTTEIVLSTLTTTIITLIIFSSVALSKKFRQKSQLPTSEERFLKEKAEIDMYV